MQVPSIGPLDDRFGAPARALKDEGVAEAGHGESNHKLENGKDENGKERGQKGHWRHQAGGELSPDAFLRSFQFCLRWDLLVEVIDPAVPAVDAICRALLPFVDVLLRCAGNVEIRSDFSDTFCLLFVEGVAFLKTAGPRKTPANPWRGKLRGLPPATETSCAPPSALRSQVPPRRPPSLF